MLIHSKNSLFSWLAFSYILSDFQHLILQTTKKNSHYLSSRTQSTHKTINYKRTEITKKLIWPNSVQEFDNV